VLVIFREDIRAHIRDDLNHICDELLFVELSTTSGPIPFGVCYLPPSQGVDGTSALSNCLLSIGNLPIFLCGLAKY